MNRRAAVAGGADLWLEPRAACGCSWHRAALVLTTIMLFPLGYAIWLSLFNYDLGSGAYDFIGLGNYSALLADERFWDIARPHRR